MKYDISQMESDADHAIDAVMNILNRDPDAKIWLEQTVKLPFITDDVWGTADIVIYLPQFDELWVLDYKYGRVVVKAVDNEQLLLYLIGSIQTLLPGRPVPKSMKIGIIQPRSDEVLDIATVTSDQLFESFLPRLKRALVAIDHKHYTRLDFDIEYNAKWLEGGLPTSQYVVSSDTCTWCPALAQCPAAQEAALEACEFEIIEPDRIEFETYLPMIPVIRKWCDKMEESALNHLSNGGEIQGYEIGKSRTHRKWTDDKAVIEMLVQHGIPLNDIAPQVLLSPSKVDKVLKSRAKKIEYQNLRMYIYQPEGKDRLQKAR